MRTSLRRLFTFAVASSIPLILAAQAPTDYQSNSPPDRIVAFAVLKTDISSKYSKVGSPVVLEIVSAANSEYYFAHLKSGEVRDSARFPDHTKFIGRIVEAQKHTKTTQAKVVIEIDEVRLKGESRELRLVLSALVILRNAQVTVYNAGGSADFTNRESVEPFDGLITGTLEGTTTLSSERDFFLKSGEATVELSRIGSPQNPSGSPN